MRLIAFAGSSMRPADLADLRLLAERHEVDLELRPPIIRGDLLSILETKPPGTRVLILDGEFGQRLSVSVTEIRHYLAGGRYLAGASSMGALRAVECRILGMRAHGWVAARYLDGTVCADDEVALLFDPETFEPVTIPLINIRWLARMLADTGSLGPDDAAGVFRLASAMHYRSRTSGALARKARQELPSRTARALVDKLDGAAMPAWDRKRLDALAALESELTELRRVDAA